MYVYSGFAVSDSDVLSEDDGVFQSEHDCINYVGRNSLL